MPTKTRNQKLKEVVQAAVAWEQDNEHLCDCAACQRLQEAVRAALIEKRR